MQWGLCAAQNVHRVVNELHKKILDICLDKREEGTKTADHGFTAVELLVCSSKASSGKQHPACCHERRNMRLPHVETPPIRFSFLFSVLNT